MASANAASPLANELRTNPQMVHERGNDYGIDEDTKVRASWDGPCKFCKGNNNGKCDHQTGNRVDPIPLSITHVVSSSVGDPTSAHVEPVRSDGLDEDHTDGNFQIRNPKLETYLFRYSKFVLRIYSINSFPILYTSPAPIVITTVCLS